MVSEYSTDKLDSEALSSGLTRKLDLRTKSSHPGGYCPVADGISLENQKDDDQDGEVH